MFSKDKPATRFEVSEYTDFVKLHVDKYSKLLSNLNQDISINYKDHSIAILKFLTNNNSKLKLNDIEDKLELIISSPLFNPSDKNTNKKGQINNENNNKDTLSNTNFNHNSK